MELNILNQDAFSADNKTWEIDRNTVTVSYTVRSNMASSVQASDFNAYIDLKDYSITGAVPVYVELKNSENSSVIQDIVAKPSVVRVSVEDLQIKKFTLTTNRRGKEKDGYVVSSIHTEPETIYATGPESSIGRISSIGILINVDGLSENTSGKEKAVFYDANGKTIDSLENVTLSQSEILHLRRPAIRRADILCPELKFLLPRSPCREMRAYWSPLPQSVFLQSMSLLQIRM